MAALRPPFTAPDIQSLYKKVLAGSFPRIPLEYSNDLSNLVNSLLRQNPNERPSTESILSNPIICKYIN